jgi:RimJ/RimL family protein N-acetyltransferase
MLVGRSIGLRALTPGDYGPLYDMAVSGDQTTWRNLAKSVPPEAFGSFMWEGVHSQRVIFPVGDPAGCLGAISLFNEDPANQVGYLSLLLASNRAPKTAAGEAVGLWLRHLFATTSLRKVYAETTALSFPQVAEAATFPGAVEEGRLRGHVLRGGTAHDLVVLAMYRDEFLNATKDLLAFIDRPHVAEPTPSATSPTWDEFIASLASSCDTIDTSALHAGGGAGGLRLVDDLGLDSIALLQVACWVEEHWGATIPDERLAGLVTVQDLYSLVEPGTPGTPTLI